MQKITYTVYETNADLEQVCLIHSGYWKDIAETIMLNRFADSGLSKDFMLLSHNDQNFVEVLFSYKTLQLRGECGA
jgi:hypothetical protein